MTINLDFLFQDEDVTSEAELPTGGGFQSGNIGLWHAQAVWRIQDDSGQTNLEDLDPQPDGANPVPWTKYYYFKYSRREDAKKTNEMLGNQFEPRLVWQWRLETADMMNWNGEGSPQDVFGDRMIQDVPITTYGSEKGRHTLHMYLLPSVVQSVAKLMGGNEKTKALVDGIEFPIFNYDDLANITTATDDGAYATAKVESNNAPVPEALLQLQQDYIGVGGDYTDSKLWQARTKIWEALGEADAAAYTLTGEKYLATSPIVRKALFLLYTSMEGDCIPFSCYARVSRVPDLFPTAVSKAGKRVDTIVVSEIYASEEDALAACNKDGGESSVDLPAIWRSAGEDEFKKWLTIFLTDKALIGKPWPVVKAAFADNDGKLAAELEESGGFTVDYVEKWLPRL